MILAELGLEFTLGLSFIPHERHEFTYVGVASPCSFHARLPNSSDIAPEVKTLPTINLQLVKYQENIFEEDIGSIKALFVS